jgi:pyridinium-3,5-bisthiocarboxylic acid mononucleotide nickel chelatase
MYFDCFAGAAGDMVLGALIDAGLPVETLRSALGSLGVGHEFEVTRVMRAGIAATHVRVREANGGHGPTHEHAHQHEHQHGDPHQHEHEHQHEHQHAHSHSHRSLAEIAHLIGHSSLSDAAKARAVALFARLAEAEAAVHNMPVEQVHLHEVGALDSIIDITGAVFALEWFGIDDIVVSPLNVGGGTVEIAHGTFPVPAPATLRLLTGAPTYSSGVQAELLTPTGALLLTAYARSYGPMPAMMVDRTGYGAGTRDLGRVPNVLRVVVGQRVDAARSAPAGESIVKIECEIDDMNPQLFGPVTDRLFAEGALDVFLTAVQMKKGRPGTLVTVLSEEARRGALVDVLFRETTTVGVRFTPMSRETLERRWVEVAVTGGTVRLKVSGRGGEVLNVIAEFDDCLRIAAATGRPVKAVQAEALRAWSGKL